MSTHEIQIVEQGCINAPLEKVFPLCCPVEEYKWIPGWKCELVHCPNQRVELGTVFRELISPPLLAGSPFAKTTWTAVLHEPQNFRLHFKLKNSASESLYKITLSDNGKGGARARLEFNYKALNKAGERVIANRGKEKIRFMLRYISLMLTHYCERGQRIGLPAMAKFMLHSKALSLTDKVHCIISRLRQLLMRDPLRDLYLKELAQGLR